MKLIKLMAILLSCLLIINCSQQETTFYDTEQRVVKKQGKWMVINYWAAWCQSCIQELPALNQFYQKHKDILLYGVSYDNLDLEDLKKVAKKVGIQFAVLTSNPAKAWGLEGIDYIPMTFIINPEGKVVDKIVGPNTEASLFAAIKKLQANEKN